MASWRQCTVECPYSSSFHFFWTMRYEILALVTCAFEHFLVHQSQVAFLIQHLAVDFTKSGNVKRPFASLWLCAQLLDKRQPTLKQTKAHCNYSTLSPYLQETIYSHWNKEHLFHQAWVHLNLYVLVSFHWFCQWVVHPYLQMPPLVQMCMWEGDPFISLCTFWIQSCQLPRNFDDLTHLPLFYLFFSYLLILLCTQELRRKRKQLFSR